MTGAFPSEYGNAISGAFDLKMRAGNNETREYIGQVGFNGFELGAEGPFSKDSKASYIANYRYSTLGVFDAMGISFGVSAVPQYQDLSFKIDVPTGLKYGRFSLFGIGGMSYIELLDSEKNPDEWTFTDTGTDAYFDSDMGVIGLSHLMFLTEKSNLKTSIAASGTRNNVRQMDVIDPSNRFDVYGNKSVSVKYTATSQYNHKFNARNFLRAGVIMDYYNVQYADSFLYDNNWYNNYDMNEWFSLAQSYVNYQYKLNENITANVGVHHQTFTYNYSTAVEPRVGLRWRVSDRQTISLGYGKHSQLQPMQVYMVETLVDTLNQTYYASNENLDFIKSDHYVLSYDFVFTPNLRLKTEAYYQNVYDVPVQSYSSSFSMANIGADFGIPLLDSLVNEGTGKNYGVEFTLEKFFSKNYYFLVTAAFYESKYIGSDGIERNTAFNGNYSFNALAGYEFKIGKRSMISLSAKMARIGGRRYIPIDLEASNLVGRAVYDMNEIHTMKHPDYFRLDGKLSFTYQGGKITQVFAADVQNVLNTQNIFQQSYDADNQVIRTEYQLGLFPVFLYKIMF